MLRATWGRHGRNRSARRDDEAAPEDTTPVGFEFVDVIDAGLSTVVTSAPALVAGINTSVPISVVGGLYSINGGSFTSAAGTVEDGDVVRAQGISFAAYNTTTNVIVTIGSVSDTFSITTTANPSDAIEIEFDTAARSFYVALLEDI